MSLKLQNSDSKGLDNVSLTAYRIITILNLLLEKPCSDVDINEALQNDIIGARSLSKDTICIYINTLRSIGCIISRPSKRNSYKFILRYHPFKIQLSDEEISFLIEIRKHISIIDDWKLHLAIDKLYNTIFDNIPAEQKKTFSRIRKSCLRDIELSNCNDLIAKLENYCDKKRTIIINYNSPESGEKKIEISAERLAYENEVFYLWGFNLATEEFQYLRLDRISGISAVNILTTESRPDNIIARYKLNGISVHSFIPNESEIIVEKNDKELIIEAVILNKFKFIQRTLSFGCDCTVISPEYIKNEVITKLKSMLVVYGN